MSTQVRSYSKINLGLAIGPTRPDGFHGLTTLYQTIGLHDLVRVEARRLGSGPSRISLTSNNSHVPTDGTNTAWRMVELALAGMGISAEVAIHIEKRLPVRGGLGAGSANAVAALVGLERELGLDSDGPQRLRLAEAIGSDVPLFLIGGAVLGVNRGEEVYPLPDLPPVECVVAAPAVGVSTPQAFRAWDALQALNSGDSLTRDAASDRLKGLSRSLASALAGSHSSGVFSKGGGLAGNQLLALVRTGIENDFEQVVFSQHPSLGTIKRLLASGSDPSLQENSSRHDALYTALSGSGSALFGLYADGAAADAAVERLKAHGTVAFRTRTLPREPYWATMIM